VNGSSNLQWVTTGGAPTVVFKDDESTVVPIGTLTNRNDYPLPIQLAQFTAARVNRGVRLEWTTLSETNNYGFEVQKSGDSVSNFQTVPNSFLPGHGTTIEPHSYMYVDSTTSSGRMWYRLKQIDLDGTTHYSDAIGVDVLSGLAEEQLATEYKLEQNYPNPFNPTTSIKYQIPTVAHVTLKVFDVLGREVATLVDGIEEPGYKSVRWNANDVASGLYFYRLQAGSFIETKKMLLLR
jgi:hypothetical protein